MKQIDQMRRRAARYLDIEGVTIAPARGVFSLSFDDFIITYFNAGTVQTFPTFIYVAAQRGIPAEANVVASAVFIATIALVVVVQLVSSSRRKRLARQA